jgi:hypothetical protein
MSDIAVVTTLKYFALFVCCLLLKIFPLLKFTFLLKFVTVKTLLPCFRFIPTAEVRTVKIYVLLNLEVKNVTVMFLCIFRMHSLHTSLTFMVTYCYNKFI